MTSIGTNLFKAYFAFASTAGSMCAARPACAGEWRNAVGDQIAVEIVVIE